MQLQSILFATQALHWNIELLINWFEYSTIFQYIQLIDILNTEDVSRMQLIQQRLGHLGQNIQERTKWNSWKTVFKNFEGTRYIRPYPFKFFKGCFSQILLGPFLNVLSQLMERVTALSNPINCSVYSMISNQWGLNQKEIVHWIF